MGKFILYCLSKKTAQAIFRRILNRDWEGQKCDYKNCISQLKTRIIYEA